MPARRQNLCHDHEVAGAIEHFGLSSAILNRVRQLVGPEHAPTYIERAILDRLDRDDA